MTSKFKCYLFTTPNATNIQIHVWNKTNGKIEFNLELDPIEIIEQIKCSASKAIVVSKLDDKTYRI
ncbi:hypothetical protein BpHYR1_051842, partial [Brachionus plicatilis]